jgi:periplasmic divalent cation tolerance protein
MDAGCLRREEKVSELILVIITASNEDEAEKIAMHLLDSGCTPCANIVSSCRSIYQWKGEIHKDDEVIMIVKSDKEKFPLICETVEGLHSYDVPEVISIRLDDASRKYRGYLEGFLR